ncbi:ABC transporter substrate-binding protein [Bacillus sp. 03113]|uniref:substrate-binding periplasmic protein n=1 Tax=Bacillus sp. 03113 TaxID=2578211 RepID=UPI0011437A9D|nr:transporter substrate-binding domain-containing protein [Bacillus sp. 03113]
MLKRSKNKFISIIMMITFILLLSACGQTEKAEDKKPATALDEVKDRGELIIGTTGDYRPFTYLDDQNKLTGYDIEWANAIAKKLGVKAKFETGEFTGLIPGLSKGRFDVVMSSVHINDERKKSVDFSDAYAMDGAVALVKKGTKSLAGPEDIKGLTVGVNAGSNWEKLVESIGGYKEMKTYPGPNESIADLMNERIDVVVMGEAAAGSYILNSPDGDKIEISGKPLDQGEASVISIAIKKDSPELVEALNKAIKELKEDGTYDKLAQKYFGMTFSDSKK